MRAFRALFQCCAAPKEESKEEREEKERRSKRDKDPLRDISMRMDEKMNIDDEFTKTEETKSIFESDSAPLEKDLKLALEDNKDLEYLQLLFEDRVIRDDEKEFITFNKKSLIEFTEKLLNYEDYELIYNQNKLVLHFRKSGTDLNQTMSLGKGSYTIPKSILKEGLTIELLVKFVYDPELRLQWDKAMKLLKKLENGLTQEAYVVRSWMHSPMFMVAEREVIDKRMEFYHEGTFYCISTSVPEDYMPTEKDVVRVKTFINTVMISQDEENFYFNTLNQVDFKMPIPQNIINVTLPMKVLSWYKSMIDGINNTNFTE